MLCHGENSVFCTHHNIIKVDLWNVYHSFHGSYSEHTMVVMKDTRIIAWSSLKISLSCYGFAKFKQGFIWKKISMDCCIIFLIVRTVQKKVLTILFHREIQTLFSVFTVLIHSVKVSNQTSKIVQEYSLEKPLLLVRGSKFWKHEESKKRHHCWCFAILKLKFLTSHSFDFFL